MSDLLTGAEIDLHKKVWEHRKTIFAHSDSRFRLYRGLTSIMPYPFSSALNKADAIMLRKMIRKWIKFLHADLDNARLVITT